MTDRDFITQATSVGLDRRGPRDPRRRTPSRPRRSLRRTTTIDTTWVDEPGGDRVIDGRARDLFTGADGVPVVVDEATLRARAKGLARTLVDLRTDPPAAGLQELGGRMVGPGFRAAVDEVLPDEAAALSLRYLLLDDLPGASLVAGYARQRSGPPLIPGRVPNDGIERTDLCAGWASEATILTLTREKGVHPIAVGPPAPPLDDRGDPWAWHDVAPMPPHGMRRARRLDLVAANEPRTPHRFDVHFRDSHTDGEGVERVVHEYTVVGAIAADGQLMDVRADAHVLPWLECPQAVGSAERLIGRSVRGLRPFVRQTFTGTTTCTHLNDTLRGLADLERLQSLLAEALA